MMEYNYKLIGERIRLERKALGISQEEFLANIKEKGKPCIGRNTLSKIENGDPKAFNAISIDQLTSICEEFNCSISYLFGEYKYRNYDNNFICTETGLAECVIDKLKIMKKEKGVLESINKIFQLGLFNAAIQLNHGNECLKKYHDLQLKSEEECSKLENIEKNMKYAEEMGTYINSAQINHLRATDIFRKITNAFIPLQD